MKIERAWKNSTHGYAYERWREISEDRAARELASTHGDDAIDKLEVVGELETRYAKYRVAEEEGGVTV